MTRALQATFVEPLAMLAVVGWSPPCGSDDDGTTEPAATEAGAETTAGGTQRRPPRRRPGNDRGNRRRGAERRSDQGHDGDHAQRRADLREHRQHRQCVCRLHQRSRRDRRPAARGPVCDEQFDPAVAPTCARQAVEEGMVSVVGSFTFFAESIVPVIAESSITWFGDAARSRLPS